MLQYYWSSDSLFPTIGAVCFTGILNFKERDPHKVFILLHSYMVQNLLKWCREGEQKCEENWMIYILQTNEVISFKFGM